LFWKENRLLENIEEVYNSMADTYFDIDIEKAKEYFNKAIVKANETGNEYIEYMSYYGKSVYYSYSQNVDSYCHHSL